MLKYDFYWDWYLPPNGTIDNGVLIDLDLHFQGQAFSSCIFCSGCLRQICLHSHVPAAELHLSLLSSYSKSYIFHRMASLWILNIMTLTYILMVTKFEMRIYWNRWKVAINAYVNLSFIFKVTNFISETMRAIEKMRHMTFTEVDIRQWMAPL